MTAPTVNPNEAPSGYVAVAAKGCTGCCFDADGDPHNYGECPTNPCCGDWRKDGCDVVFVRKEKK